MSFDSLKGPAIAYPGLEQITGNTQAAALLVAKLVQIALGNPNSQN
jgi:hypothetical protein